MSNSQILNCLSKGDSVKINKVDNVQYAERKKHNIKKSDLETSLKVLDLKKEDNIYKLQKDSILTDIGTVDLFLNPEEDGMMDKLVGGLKKFFNIEDVQTMILAEDDLDRKFSLILSKEGKLYLSLHKTCICEVKDFEKV